MMALVLDILTTAAILFIVASGLLIVFGVMKIINFAHGAFMTVGAYAALITSNLALPAIMAPFLPSFWVGSWRRRRVRNCEAAVSSTPRCDPGDLGTGHCRGAARDPDFRARGAVRPGAGLRHDGRFRRELFRRIGCFSSRSAILIGALFTALLNGTRLGLNTRAVIMNETLAQGLGIDSSRVRLLTFGIGSGLAAVAGAAVTPLASVDPNMGLPWLIGAFMLVMVSGGSLLTLALACFALGGLQVLVSTFVSPILGGLTIAVLAAVALRLRPEGFARA